MRTLICQFWTESERGYGQRPDGCTIHETPEDCMAFVSDYIMRNNPSGEPVPNEYSFPDFDGKHLLRVDEELAQRLDKAKAEGRLGAWLFNSEFSYDQEKRELRVRK